MNALPQSDCSNGNGVLQGFLFRKRNRSRFSPAFSLVEIIIALGIFSFVIVAILGTMTVALNSTRDSEMKLRAANVGATIIGRIKANPTNLSDTRFFPFGKFANWSNAPSVGSNFVYVDLQGRQVASNEAAFRLGWMVQTNLTTNLYYYYFDLTWPPNVAPANAKGSHRIATSILMP